MGAQIVPEDNFSIALSMAALKILGKAKVSGNDLCLVETVLLQALQRTTNIVYAGYLIDFGRIEIPQWVQEQMKCL